MHREKDFFRKIAILLAIVRGTLLERSSFKEVPEKISSERRASTLLRLLVCVLNIFADYNKRFGNFQALNFKTFLDWIGAV